LYVNVKRLDVRFAFLLQFFDDVVYDNRLIDFCGLCVWELCGCIVT